MGDYEIEQRSIQGNEQAILQLLQRNREKLYRIAYSYCRNEQDALDAIQELTYKTFKKIHTVKNPAYVDTWLVRVLINICLDIKKKKGYEEPREQIEQSDCLHQDSLELSDLIQQLPLDQQELIFLKYFRDLRNQDIATIKNIPEGTVKSRLHKALKSLRLLIRKEE